jgi:hypothetical protein
MIDMSRKTVVSGLIVLCAVVIGAVPMFGQVAFQTSFPNSIIRPEGKTEQLGPIVFQSTSLGAGRTVSAGSTITITFNATVTNTVGTGITLTCNIASLYVAPPAPPAAPTTPSCGSAVAPITQITGSATGTTNVFTIAFPAGAATTFAAGDSLTVSGVRIDATLVGPSANVTATISGNSSAPSTNPITFTATQANVATTAAQTLSVAIGPNGAGKSAVTNILTCSVAGVGGSPAGLTTFSVSATEKVLAGLTTSADEPGSTVGVTVNVIITGVPAGLTVSPLLPVTSGTGVTLAFGGAGGVPASILSTGTTQVMTFAYVVSADNVGAFETVNFPFAVGLPSGNLGALGSIGTPATVTAQVSLAGSTAAAGILRFGTNVQPATPITVASIGDCVTYLLFPFVTNGNSVSPSDVAGFDTSFAIANTTADANAFVTNAATIQNGSCTLTLYPSDVTTGTLPTTPNPVFVTPKINSGVSWGYFMSGMNSTTSATGGVGTFAGQAGYIIAVCQFLNAHAIAYVTNGFASTGSLSHGYLALVIPSPLTNRGATGGAGETLGH